MLSYIGKRMLHGAVAMIGLIVVVFFMARLTGNPSALYLPVEATEEAIAEFSRSQGFDAPVIVQFGRFLEGLLHFDFGESLRQNRPALQVVAEAYPTTLKLAALAMTVALVVAIVTGALAAWKPSGVFDRIATLLSLIGASAPNFWIAIVGIMVFAVGLQWLPTSGTGGPIYWILPVTVMALRPCGLLTQVVRGSMITALSSDYVKTARAKGATNRVIIFVHALRNAMLPVITVAGDQAAGMVNGAVIVETVFGFPGIGKLLIDSISYRDFAVVQAAVLITAAAIFAINIVIDLAYALLDPRIRYS
jgi:peptide/nickel transport system permease protein